MMGQPINFEGSNLVMRAPEGAENVQDMYVFRSRHSCVSCWTLAPEEITEINQSGRIFLSVLAGGQQPPVYVGSERACREVMVDFGPVWPMTKRQTETAPKMAVNEALRLVIAYDDLLRTHEGPSDTLFAGDVAEIDAAYDEMVAAVRTALEASEGSTDGR